MTPRRVSLGRCFRPWGLVCILTASVCVCTFEPTSSIAAEKPSPQHADIGHWLDGLSSRNPFVREAAYRHLTGLTREGLMSFRETVKDRIPALAGREDLIHDIVTQVYLATEPYAADPLRGFLGVRFDIDQGVKFETEFFEPTPYKGVEVRHLIPGLTASRYLEEGDVILAVRVDQRVVEPERAEEIQSLVLELPAGTRLTVLVQRRGKVTPIELALGACPLAMESDHDLSQFSGERQADAEAYWDEHFGPLFAPLQSSRAAADPNP